ncbi:LacI family DNA-binding transcriptional regulator [Novosphingobium sp. BL-8A]|uniref:LacI family DNA-binding transcriptional regulator n=1 Tax=Novosphingobium sp. BL-8A TaxID=3127639 RepID=UPI003757891F
MGRPRQDENRVTIQAVAKRVGVSAMTVSNVINRTGRASRDTRERVLAAIADLGYVPNQSARRLVGASVACVGLIYSAVESVFVEATLAAVAVIAAENGIQLQIRSVNDASPEDVSAAAQDMIRKGAQALLLLPPYAEMLGEQAHREGLGVPAAAIATAMALPHITTVRIDNREAMRAITQRLIAQGRRRIAVIAGPPRHSDGVARLKGYRDALRANGMTVDPAYEAEGDFTFQSGLAAAERLLDLSPRPDAIVATNDDMAAAVLWIAHQRGLRLPADLSVTGFDDTLIATRVWPPLTTVRQPIREMAKDAMEWLAGAVRHPDRHAVPGDIVLPFTLVDRHSA